MRKKKILFVCVQNSARSQMAEAYMNAICGQDFEAQSSGLSPGDLNPLAVQVMREEGIDISQRSTKSVFDLFKSGEMFGYVVTVCDQSTAEKCPVFPGVTTRLHWSFADPGAFQGTHENKLRATREVRDQIKRAVLEFCQTNCSSTPNLHTSHG
jgi:arsenate reductase